MIKTRRTALGSVDAARNYSSGDAKSLFIALVLACVTGCASDDSAAPPAGVVGSDRDEHGCIGSAGYRWCEHSGQCERPWELAKKAGFENTPEQFDAYCAQ